MNIFKLSSTISKLSIILIKYIATTASLMLLSTSFASANAINPDELARASKERLNSGNRAQEKKLSPNKQFKVRMSEEKRIAEKDTMYKQQNNKLIEHYKKLATQIKNNGGDPAPLLKAIAHLSEKDQ